MSYWEKCPREKCLRENCPREKWLLGRNVLHSLFTYKRRSNHVHSKGLYYIILFDNTFTVIRKSSTKSMIIQDNNFSTDAF